jgi:nitrogen fixation NifU-like protein
MSDDLYHQQLLDIYQDPSHFGRLEHPDLVLTETNASCGDSFTFYLKFHPHHPHLRGGVAPAAHLRAEISPDATIQSISFTGQGCVISTVASSLLVDYLIGKPMTTLNHIDQAFMETLLGISITPARLKCLMLPQRALATLG